VEHAIPLHGCHLPSVQQGLAEQQADWPKGGNGKAGLHESAFEFDVQSSVREGLLAKHQARSARGVHGAC
jgi:hypothetical protein